MPNETINLNELMNEHTINLNLQADSKQSALSQLVDLLVKEQAVSSKEGFLQDVYEREAQGQTGIGSSIAIPHGKSESVIKNAIAIGRTNNELEWESLDDQPVHIIILFAVKSEDQNDLHLKLLATVASSLAHEEVCEQLIHAQSPEEITNILQNK